ncbi:receptor-interacting serine/threonine-protein kinase 1 isoform X2 [Varanus komodoensis]|uniref:receptor-interacting serine/threonine-protein kinase 1 isoform X2 n=1 Tax=Varanus komodoensis TaxID=61221 RepID=UPI001CF794B2|nr:receptor-interacting serine/threonine-protein kinase 1 isoform X2 [Varanus komodoensis]
MSLVDIQMNSEDLLQKEQLDAGGFGMVSLCYHKRHGLVVLKTVYTGPQRTECNTSLLEEGKIMYKLNHDRVVKLLGVILEDGNYSLVMEYVRKGNLMTVLKATPIPLSVKGRFILEITEGMLYLTEQGLVHKDLKPENILVDEDFHIKIADLGVACFKNWSRLTKEETSRQRKIKCSSKSNAGTLFYMAPEHLMDINTTPVEKSDVYSFGIVLWAIFADKEPYENAVNDMHVCFCVMHGDRPLIDEIQNNCPKVIITLMKDSWKQKPEERPTFAEISLTYTPFYQQNFEEFVEEDVRKIKEVYPEPTELVKRMQSLEVDAVAEPPGSAQMDRPSSLHSSQGLAVNSIDEAQFAASPSNEPVESCEHTFEPPMTLERKLQDELNYHVYGSRMDKPDSHPVVFSAALGEEEHRRKMSYGPFAKGPVEPYLRPENPRLNTSLSNPNAACYNASWQPSSTGATPERGNIFLPPNRIHGAEPTNLRASLSSEDLYGSHSTSLFNLSKPPVPESDPRESLPFMKTNFAHASTYRKSSEDSAQFVINNSRGIQIGSNNYMKIKEPVHQISSAPANVPYNSVHYQKLFESAVLASDIHLNLVRDNLAKQWKHCARKLGFTDPELDEIDHDYERDGLKEKVYQMFQRWLMKEGSKGATVGKLALALYACRRIDLLNSLVKTTQESEMSNK